jgi:iron complex outermembrane receptor protein
MAGSGVGPTNSLRRSYVLRLAYLSLTVVLLMAIPTWAQQKYTDLGDESIEDLMNIKVTSVSKTEEKLSRTASAIFVITQSDIRGSGATNIPDLLRMVPGLDVAQIDGSTWAISARGFNQQSSNKLLVLVDGRTVYSPLFSGVYWDAQAIPLDEIDRIEVIRGPGASVWGANAVNGVISIITKGTDQTQGGSVTAGAGTNDRGFGTARFGGEFGDGGTYRISSNYSNHTHLLDLAGQNGEDAWNILHADLRADKALTAKDSLTVDLSGYDGTEGERVFTVTSISPPVNQVLNLSERFSGWSLSSKWGHVSSPHSDITLGIYFDRTDRSDSTNGQGVETFNMDFQHHLQLGERNNVVWGLGYRHVSDETQGSLRVAFNPADQRDDIFNSFFQDEIAIRPERLYVTLGAKLEHNDFTGVTFQPSARLAWVANDHSMVWSSFSIAQRTPSFADLGVRFTEQATPGPGGLPLLVTAFGNPNEKNENLFATELGYREEWSKDVSIDLTTFFNRYRDLRSTEPMAPLLQSNLSTPYLVVPFDFGNLLYGETHGIEAAVSWKVSDRWTLSPGYAFLSMHLHREPTSEDFVTGPATEGSSPTHQAEIRSRLLLPDRFQFDVSGFFVDRLPSQSVPSYTRLDAGITWQAAERFSIAIVGQNLLKDHHLETTNTDEIVQSSLKRSAYAKFAWQF